MHCLFKRSFHESCKNTLKFNLEIAKTGVKYLHHKAKNYNLAIYFESNGHGIIYYKPEIEKKIELFNCLVESSQDSQILELISIFLSLFNILTGDSLSALNATECSLRLMNMSIMDLYNIYTELDYVNIKVKVNDKNIFSPNEDETRLIEPASLQEKIDEICLKYSDSLGRCFVRPSGTEDVVRILSRPNLKQMQKQ